MNKIKAIKLVDKLINRIESLETEACSIREKLEEVYDLLNEQEKECLEK